GDELAEVGPLLAVVAVDVSLVIARCVERTLVNDQCRDALAAWSAAVDPLITSLMAVETGRVVQRRGMELVWEDAEPADGSGTGALPAAGPFRPAFVAIDPPAEMRIIRLRQGGASETILADPRIELALEHRQRRHRVALRRCAAIEPGLPIS